MLRFFRRGTLRRRRSASCPNLADVPPVTNDGSYKRAESLFESDDSEAGDVDGEAHASRQERLKAQKTIKLGKQREKTQKENVEKNLISMNDFLGKMSELKIWIKEEKKKNVATLKSPKLREYYKSFMKLYNKRKLPAKYYRSCAADRTDSDCASPVSRYTSKVTPASVAVPSPADVSINLANGFEVDSNFSTFGKQPDVATLKPYPPPSEPNSEYDVPPIPVKNIELPSHLERQHPRTASLKKTSPHKFATITRGTPPSYLQAKGDAKVHPVSTPQCPGVPIPVVSTPRCSEINSNCPPTSTESDPCTKYQSSPEYADVRDAIPFCKGSPKYAEISQGLCHEISNSEISPDYTSISSFRQTDSFNILPAPPKTRSFNRRRSKSMEDIYAVPSKLLSYDNRQRVIREESFSSIVGPPPPIPERNFREKETEMSSLDSRCFNPPFESFFQRRNSYRRDSFTKAILNKTNLAHISGTEADHMQLSHNTSVSSGIYSMDYFDGSMDATEKKSGKKRRSEEASVISEESESTSIDTKKCRPNYPDISKKLALSSATSFTRAESMSNSTLTSCTDSVFSSEVDRFNTNPDQSRKFPTFKKTNSISSNISSVSTNSRLVNVTKFEADQNLASMSRTNSTSSNISSVSTVSSTLSRPKLSILTGSYQATTRSPFKDLEETNIENNKTESDMNLSSLSIRELDGSPKLPRRRLKRRSSSLSTTPGKGLTFGKMSKVYSSPRRVSFARDVKDTDGSSTPRRNLPKQSSLASSAPPVTRQTQDRRQFETFLSAHQSPPKKSPPKKSLSLGKSRSHVRTSPLMGRLALQANGVPVRRSPRTSTMKNESPRSFTNGSLARRSRSVDRQTEEESESLDHLTAGRIFHVTGVKEEAESASSLISDISEQETDIDQVSELTESVSSEVSVFGEDMRPNSGKVYQTMKFKEIECNQDTRVNLLLAEFHARTASSSLDDVEDVKFLSSTASSSSLSQSTSLLAGKLRQACMESVSSTSKLLEKDISESFQSYFTLGDSDRLEESISQDFSSSRHSVEDISGGLSNLSEQPRGDVTDNSGSSFKKETSTSRLDLISDTLGESRTESCVSIDSNKSNLGQNNFSPLKSPLSLDCKIDQCIDSTSSQREENSEDSFVAATAFFSADEFPGLSRQASTNVKSSTSQECLLQRIESYRASPKVVDNDGWITERRRSSKGRSSRSFRANYNNQLLSESSFCEESILEKDLAEFETETKVDLSANASIDISPALGIAALKSDQKTSELVSNSLPNDEAKVNASPVKRAPSEKPKPTVLTPVKPKPAVLPKSKGISYKVNVNNFISSSPSSGRKSSGRKSLSRRESGDAKENFIRRNIAAVRRESIRLSDQSINRGKKDNQKLSVVNIPIDSKSVISSKVKSRRESRVSSLRRESSTKKESPVKEGIEIGSRRSSTKLMSFADRKKFFQQMHEEKKVASPARNNTAKFTRSVPEREGSGVSPCLTSARVFRTKTQEVNRSLVLSPKKDTAV